MNWKERSYCGRLTTSHGGRDVLLLGWVDAIRDHGNLLFIHLRDTGGIVQVVFDPRESRPTYEQATSLREEYVIEVRGRVSLREKGTENPNLETGHIEVFARSLVILAKAKALPFQITEKAMVFGEEVEANPDNVDEELRLRYRFLDFRRPSVQELFKKRSHILKSVRDYFHGLDFIEIETPILTKSTPEGARDYLVPSRVHRGKYYALPQSPQLFKQLLMVGGMDRYYQIARCFRDEDLRPNRQPEFTQLDMEASFIDETFIYDVIEQLTVRIFDIGGITLQRPFPRLTHKESMDRYGTDCPDRRFDMAFEEVTDIVRETSYGIFRGIAKQGGHIKGFCVKGQSGALSKNVLQNEYALKVAPSFGAKGMTWMKLVDGKLQSNIVQFFSQREQEGLIGRFSAEEGDVILMIADLSPDLVNSVLCSLRLHLAQRLKLAPKDSFSPVWITDFPLFELKDEKVTSPHHPFTMPERSDFDPTNREELLGLKSRAYDLVMNGEELGGGSIRIHELQTQRKVFEAVGLSHEEVESKFGFFLRALEYGAPPHGGLALGLDRIVAMILNASSIRDVIAFPKNRSALCPLTDAPSVVDTLQLKELGLESLPPGEKPGRRPREPGERQALEPEAPQESGRISRAEVTHVASLSRMRLEGTELRSFQKDLNAILEYVETLNELDTEAVQPMGHVLGVKNVWREDKPARSNRRGAMLSNAPAREGDYFKVPKILEG